ncbi:MAG TPA: hypothetical protein VHL11_23550, partial [Phototrophicaceae bacterium]|nr:hypothetical protein [Phototrophicaceae bacterium]
MVTDSQNLTYLHKNSLVIEDGRVKKLKIFWELMYNIGYRNGFKNPLNVDGKTISYTLTILFGMFSLCTGVFV